MADQSCAYPGVYFVRWGKHIKIGCADNVCRRLHMLKGTIPEGELEPLGWIRVVYGPEKQLPRYREHEIHETLAAFRGRGEWFRDCKDVRCFIARYADPWPE